MSQRLRQEKAARLEQKSSWRLVGIVIAGVIAVMLGVGVVAILLITHTAPPPSVHTDPSAARRLLHELDEAQNSAAKNSRTVSADETELNSLVGQYWRSNGSSSSATAAAAVRDMKMTLNGDRLLLYVVANVQGREITLQLEGHLRTANGYMDFDPISGKIGSLPLPRRTLKRAVKRLLEDPEGLAATRLPRNVADLHIANSKLVVVFK